jgi:hypothetical protein
MAVGVLPTNTAPDAPQRTQMLASLKYGLKNGLLRLSA